MTSTPANMSPKSEKSGKGSSDKPVGRSKAAASVSPPSKRIKGDAIAPNPLAGAAAEVRRDPGLGLRLAIMAGILTADGNLDESYT